MFVLLVTVVCSHNGWVSPHGPTGVRSFESAWMFLVDDDSDQRGYDFLSGSRRIIRFKSFLRVAYLKSKLYMDESLKPLVKFFQILELNPVMTALVCCVLTPSKSDPQQSNSETLIL